MSEIEYRYFLFHSSWLARLDKNLYGLEPKEFLKNGVWQYDDESNRRLNDCMMDYGNWSVFDYEEISEDDALRFIASQENLNL